MKKMMIVLSALTISAYLCGSAGGAASAAGKTSLVGSGGVQGLMEQQSACAAPEKSERSWEFKTGESPNSVMFSPDGALLAVANTGSHNISVFSVNNEGILAPVQGSPFGVGLIPNSIVFSPDGTLLVVVNQGSSNISVFSVNNEKALVPVQGSPFVAERPADSAVFSPDGRLLAVVNYSSHSISVFYNDKGILVPVKGSPFGVGENPSSIAFSPDGKLVVANLHSHTVSLFSIDQGVVKQTQRSQFAVGQGPIDVAFSLDGKLLAVANHGSHNVSVFLVNDEGALVPVRGSPFGVGKNPRSVVFSPNNKLLAVRNRGSDNISLFLVNKGTMMPAQGSPFATKGYGSIAFSPNSRLLAITSYGSNAVLMYEVDPDTGVISPITYRPLKESKEKFSPETEVMSVPNESGGFSIVPRKEGEKIMAELQARKVAAIKHIIAEWQKELDASSDSEAKVKILQRWAKIALEKKWAALGEDFIIAFTKERLRALDAYKREIATGKINHDEPDMGATLERLRKDELKMWLQTQRFTPAYLSLDKPLPYEKIENEMGIDQSLL